MAYSTPKLTDCLLAPLFSLLTSGSPNTSHDGLLDGSPDGLLVASLPAGASDGLRVYSLIGSLTRSLDSRCLMPDAVVRVARGEAQRLWLANIPLSSYNLWSVVGDDVAKFLWQVARLSSFRGCRVAGFRVLGDANLNNLTGWSLWASVVMGLRTCT